MKISIQISFQLKHQMHFQPMHTCSSSSNTYATQLKYKLFSRVDNVQKKCKTSLSSFLDLLASTVSM